MHNFQDVTQDFKQNVVNILLPVPSQRYLIDRVQAPILSCQIFLRSDQMICHSID